MSEARVSVIVPVRDRRELLSNLLDALDQQTFRDFEVIVVDDGSTDGSDVVAAGRSVCDRPIVLTRSDSRGAVAARRLGVARSGAEVLAFTDSDCRPDREWLEAGVRAIDDGAAMVNGLTRPERELRPLERSMSSGTEGLYPTCNMFFRRNVFEEFGGLDENAVTRLGFRLGKRASGLGFGEDTLLAWRIKRSGVPSRFAPDAVVEHHVFAADVREAASRAFQAAAFPALVREVPELRQTLLVRGVLLGTRRIPFYTVALAAATGRRRVALTASLWWAWRRTRDLPAPTGTPANLAWVPVEMALDVVLGISLLAGSLRSGTVVL